jgi:hypothetical protein
MIRLRIRKLNLEVIKPKLWEAGIVVILAIAAAAAYAYLVR